MFIAKLVPVLFLAYLAQGSDLDVAYAIMDCAQRAIEYGVPDLDIPAHDPVYISTNLSWSGDIAIASISMNLTDGVWGGLPFWKVTGVQLNNDEDDFAVFNFTLWWDWMDIAFNYTLKSQEVIFEQVQNGTLEFEFNNTEWTGSINVTKPNRNLTETVNDVQIDWSVETLTTRVTGLGLFSDAVAATLGTGLQTTLNNKLEGNSVGDFIKYRLETIWWSTGKIWELTTWCQQNPANTTFSH